MKYLADRFFKMTKGALQNFLKKKSGVHAGSGLELPPASLFRDFALILLPSPALSLSCVEWYHEETFPGSLCALSNDFDVEANFAKFCMVKNQSAIKDVCRLG